jgi:hypothetical protein
VAFVSSQVWQQRSDARLGFESAGLSLSDGLPNADVTAWGELIRVEFVDVVSKVAAREVQNGHEFDVAGTAKLRYRKLSELELPDGSVWTPEFGAMRADVVLLSKPSMAALEPMHTVGRFRVVLPIGTYLAYQPPLTAGEIAAGRVRPGWCVGSYAVFAGDGRKLGHIPRPFAVDGDGKWTWGEWDYSAGILSKRVSRAWLDAARYPVTVDASLGFASIGGSNTGSGPDYMAGYGPWTASEDGTANTVYWYVSALSSTPVTLGIYDDNSNPNSLLGDSAGATENTDGWISQALDSGVSLTNGITYWVGQNHGDDTIQLYYDTDASYDWKYNAEAYSSGALTNPFPTPISTLANYKVSAYIDYTPAAGGVAPTSHLYGSLVGPLGGPV